MLIIAWLEMKYTEIKKTVRDLRKNMTPAERILWKELRNRRFRNKKFLRQHPVIYESVRNEHFFYVADFYCSEHKLVIELDGKYHDFQKEKDCNRDLIMNELGLTVLRFKNEETENMERLLGRIGELIDKMERNENG